MMCCTCACERTNEWIGSYKQSAGGSIALWNMFVICVAFFLLFVTYFPVLVRCFSFVFVDYLLISFSKSFNIHQNGQVGFWSLGCLYIGFSLGNVLSSSVVLSFGDRYFIDSYLFNVI